MFPLWKDEVFLRKEGYTLSSLFTIEVKPSETIKLPIKTSIPGSSNMKTSMVFSDQRNIVVDMSPYDVLVLNPTWDVRMSTQIEKLKSLIESLSQVEGDIDEVTVQRILEYGAVR